MATPDGIRSSMIDAAASIDVGDLDAARADVRSVVRRRRVRARFGAGFGVAALVIGGAIVMTAGSDEPDTLVSADPTLVESPVATVATVESTSPAEVAPTAPTVVVLDRPGVAGAGAGQGAPVAAEWATPWRDGFLVGSSVFPPQPLPERLPDEVRALFPQEVLDLFVDGLPATIAEATEMLSAAGLLDEVSTVISEHPEASAAIYGEPVTTTPTLEARFTTDGVTWEPVEMTLPPGASYLASVTAVDDRLVVAYGEQFAIEPDREPSVNTATVKIASTTDLTNWTIQEIGPSAPPIELPDGIERSVSAQGLVANGSGWAVTVYESIQPDVQRLLPDDVRARLDEENAEGNGYGVSYDDTGVSIEYYGTDGTPMQSVRFEWDELGIGPDVVAYLSDNEFRPQVWAAAWDGEPVRSDGPVGSGLLVATAAGFLQWGEQTWFSADGLTWTASPLPVPNGSVNTAIAFDGGVVVVSVDADGVIRLHRLDETGGSPEPLDVPGLPEVFQAGYGSPWAPGSAIVLDAAVPDRPAPLEIDVEGYRLTIDRYTGALTLTDLATGAQVASERGESVGSVESAFSYDVDGLTVRDSATGDVLVVIPTDTMRQAEEATFGAFEGDEYVPDYWLLATADGERFVVDDLDDLEGAGGPIAAVTNNDAALAHVGDSWIRYDLS